jgi:hypothetical protein
MVNRRPSDLTGWTEGIRGTLRISATLGVPVASSPPCRRVRRGRATCFTFFAIRTLVAAIFCHIRISILDGFGRSRALGHFGRGSVLHQTIQKRWYFCPARPNAIGIVGGYVQLGGCVLVRLACSWRLSSRFGPLAGVGVLGLADRFYHRWHGRRAAWNTERHHYHQAADSKKSVRNRVRPSILKLDQ